MPQFTVTDPVICVGVWGLKLVWVITCCDMSGCDPPLIFFHGCICVNKPLLKFPFNDYVKMGRTGSHGPNLFGVVTVKEDYLDDENEEDGMGDISVKDE